ncbi:hypothetical protein [Trebonia kvetii]|uniref:hypothetical protein n=1 Tax=Trebonia kvetii TaxID=2480626 RepID=UPI00165298C8|nr:hypothetical protein [Trebonia kvetii]
MRETGQCQNDDSLEGGNCGAAEAFPDNYRRPAYRRDQHLSQETELPVTCARFMSLTVASESLMVRPV